MTGGAGFIGGHLCAALLDRGDLVTVVDNFDLFYPERLKRRALVPLLARGLLLREADIRDEPTLRTIFAEFKPDCVVHLAALAGVRPSLDNPGAYQDVNVRGTAHVLEAARLSGVKRIALGSSSSVYGALSKPPFREDSLIDSPLSPYAASKAATELLGRTFHHLYGLEVAALRFFTVYGPRQRPDLAIHKFARLMLAKKPLPFFGDGETRRDYTWVDDIVAGVVASLEVPLQYETLNLGGAQTNSLRDLIALLEEALGVKAVLDRKPAQAGDMIVTSADVTRAAAVLGYAPKTPLREGLAKFAEWMRGEGQTWV